MTLRRYERGERRQPLAARNHRSSECMRRSSRYILTRCTVGPQARSVPLISGVERGVQPHLRGAVTEAKGMLRLHHRRRCRHRPVRQRSPHRNARRGAQSWRGAGDARRTPLDALVDCVDARVAEEMGEAGAVMRAEGLPEPARSADTAERLGAPQETLRMDATESANEAAGGFRASEAEGRRRSFPPLAKAPSRNFPHLAKAPSRSLPPLAEAARSEIDPPLPAQRHRPVGLRGRRGHARHRLARD